MNNRILWVTTLMLLFSSLLIGQNAQRQQTREEVKNYFNEQVKPLLVEQQNIYVQSLSAKEKSRLEEIQTTFGNSRFSQNGKRGRNGNGGTYNCIARAEEITANHPDQNKAYRQFIDDHKSKWVEEIKAIHEKNGVTQIKNADGNTGQEFWLDRLENPETLLLMNSDRPFPGFGQGSGRGMGRNGNRGNGDCRNMGYGMRSGVNPMINNEMIPMVAKERLAFDIQLSNAEKETIDLARQKIQVRKAMFKAWRESEDFVPGARRDDPNFDAMRADMQESMQAVRNIALNHSSEIRQSLDEIRDLNPDMGDCPKYGMNNHRKGRGFKGNQRGHGNKWNTPMGFLLFDPANAEESASADLENEALISVFPNPVNETGTVKIGNANGQNIEVLLLNQDGSQHEKLFSGQVNDDLFEVAIQASGLDEGIYFVQVILDGKTTTKKMVVKR
ncbi:MAG: T9SS type A sorting domain-containing protein [Bacteroidales bacterium]|nr:T9SS type A sorting domain-containing protein [Bacteroidales bacterium]